jgi:hypothetical protein
MRCIMNETRHRRKENYFVEAIFNCYFLVSDITKLNYIYNCLLKNSLGDFGTNYKRLPIRGRESVGVN